MRRFLVSTLLVLLLAPSICSAKQTVWNMKGVDKLESWNHKGFSQISLTPEGLFIVTETQGQLARKGPISHKVDTVTINYSSPTGANGIFFWQTPDMEGNNAYNIPIRFGPSAGSTSMVLDLSKLPQWTPKSKLIGFNFNEGTQIILESIIFNGPSIGDTIKHSARSIFVFDTYRGHSVNFLWGPRLVNTSEAISIVYAEMPPIGKSWNQVFYWLLLIILIPLVLIKRRTEKPWLPTFLICFAVLWVLYDARMGSEILSYAKTDWNTWWSKPIELKDFRDRGSFTAFTKVATEFIQDEQHYALITPSGWPYFGSMTYETYPAIPKALSEDLSDVKLWFVYRMPNVSLDEQNRITVNGEPISPPGEIFLRFEPGAFMFRTL